MTTSSRQRVFPLHLSPIEKFMRTDDRPGHPMAFVIHMQFSGTIDRGAFEASLGEALQRHPLLRCLVRPAKQNQPCWVPAPDLAPSVDWAPDSEPVTCPHGEQIDLEREVGLRIWVREGDEQVRLIMQFHHACCDGIGAYRFIGDLLALYGSRTGTDHAPPSLHPIDEARLRSRWHGSTELARSGERGRLIRSSLAQTYQLLVRGCTPLYPAKSPLRAGREHTCETFPGIRSYTFSRDEHQRLRDVARQSGAMLNDLLLAELFHVLYQWNAAQRPWRPGRRLRIMMPVDLRDAEDYETPAANMMSYTFLTRRPSDLKKGELLLRSIRDETARIKHQQLGKRFIDTVTAACNVRGLLPLALGLPRSMATVVMSNVGDPSRRFTARLPRRKGRIVCGNLVLDEFTGVPPMRPRTRATFSIFGYSRRLTISLRCNPHRFTMKDTEQLLSLYVERLRRHLC